MLLDEFWFGFWGYWHSEKFVLSLCEYFHDVCGKSLLVCANFVLWTWQNFVGYVHRYICRDGQILWVWNFDLWKNFVRYVMLILGKFVWLWFWLCENLYVHELVEFFFFFFIAMEKFGSCMDMWKILIVVKFWWGIDFFFFYYYYYYYYYFFFGGGALIFYSFIIIIIIIILVVGHWLWEYFLRKFLVMWVLVMEIDELNFYVAKS